MQTPDAGDACSKQHEHTRHACAPSSSGGVTQSCDKLHEGPDFFRTNLHVFDGSATCEEDKLRLVLPILGLYAEQLAVRHKFKLEAKRSAPASVDACALQGSLASVTGSPSVSSFRSRATAEERTQTSGTSMFKHFRWLQSSVARAFGSVAKRWSRQSVKSRMDSAELELDQLAAVTDYYGCNDQFGRLGSQIHTGARRLTNGCEMSEGRCVHGMQNDMKCSDRWTDE